MPQKTRITNRKMFITVALAVLLLVSGCEGPFDLATALGLDPGVLTISPDAVTIFKDIPQTMTVSGGTEPYNWTIYSGTGQLSSNSGSSVTYDPEGLAGITTLQVSDLDGLLVRTTLTVQNTITTLELLAGVTVLNFGESIRIFAVGGDNSYSYSFTANNSGASFIDNGDYIDYTAGISPGIDTLELSDGSGDLALLSITVQSPPVIVPDVDYIVASVSILTIPTSLGETIDARFDLQNIGGTDGFNDVVWRAYASKTTDLTGVVSLLSSGTSGSLTAGDSIMVDVNSGSWPSIPDTYNLVIHLTTAADSDPDNNINSSADVLMSVRYDSMGAPAGATVTNRTQSTVNFTLKNNGTVDGIATGTWIAYLSDNDTFESGTDTPIDSGSFGPIVVADTEIIPVDATWPDYPAAWVFMEWNSADAGATGSEGSGVFTVIITETDYSIDTAPIPAGLQETGAAINGSFTVTNNGPNLDPDGYSWSVVASWDTGLEPVVLLDSGTETGLGVTGSQTINYSSSWPSSGGDYHIVIIIESLWDINASDNTFVVGPILIDDIGVDLENNDSTGPFPTNTPTFTTDLDAYIPAGKLRPGERIRINGTIESNNASDTYGFTASDIAGAEMNSVRLELTWVSGTDALDMYLWDALLDAHVPSEDIDNDVEGPMTVTGIDPGEVIYIGVLSLPGHNGQSYTLTITGLP